MMYVSLADAPYQYVYIYTCMYVHKCMIIYVYIILYIYIEHPLSLSLALSFLIVYCQKHWQPCGKHPCREDQEITLFRFQCLEEMCIKLHQYISTSGSCGGKSSERSLSFICREMLNKSRKSVMATYVQSFNHAKWLGSGFCRQQATTTTV